MQRMEPGICNALIDYNNYLYMLWKIFLKNVNYNKYLIYFALYIFLSTEILIKKPVIPMVSFYFNQYSWSQKCVMKNP